MKRVFLFLVLAIFTIGCYSDLKNNEDNNLIKKDCIVGILDDNLYSDSKFIDNLIYDLSNRFNINAKKLTIDETEHFNLEDANVIFGIGLNMSDYIPTLASKNPDRNFVLMDFVLDLDLPNLCYAPFDLDDSSFVSGMILSNISKTGYLGYLGGEEVDIIKNSYYAFCAGAKYESRKENKDVGINLKYLRSFHDLSNLKDITSDFLLENVDCLFSFSCGMDENLINLLKEQVFVVNIDDYLGHANSDFVIKKDYVSAINEILNNRGKKVSVFNLFNGGVKLFIKNDNSINVNDYILDVQDFLKNHNLYIPTNQNEYDLFLEKINEL